SAGGATACSTASSDSAGNQASDLAAWTKVVSCNGSAVVVDILNFPGPEPLPHNMTPYTVQAVIRDEAVIRYFESTRLVSRNPANAAEVILPGTQYFSWPFNGTFNSLAIEPSSGKSFTTHVSRMGQGLKISFDETDASTCPSFCTNPSDPDYNPSSGVCEG